MEIVGVTDASIVLAEVAVVGGLLPVRIAARPVLQEPNTFPFLLYAVLIQQLVVVDNIYVDNNIVFV